MADHQLGAPAQKGPDEPTRGEWCRAYRVAVCNRPDPALQWALSLRVDLGPGLARRLFEIVDALNAMGRPAGYDFDQATTIFIMEALGQFTDGVCGPLGEAIIDSALHSSRVEVG